MADLNRRGPEPLPLQIFVASCYALVAVALLAVALQPLTDIGPGQSLLLFAGLTPAFLTAVRRRSRDDRHADQDDS